MPRPQFQHDIYRFVAGPLGYLEGVTVSHRSAPSQPLIRYFGGIEYALPPIGPYRFRRPRSLPLCYRYGTKANPGRFTRGTAFCPQPDSSLKLDTSLWDEDCLQLNIYVPANKKVPANGWPVFFYIHGGFLQWGTANQSPNAMTPFLTETAFEAIVVMPSYRLNLFGFLSGTELQAEAQRSGEAAGNMGFWDQRLALEWTARNITHFGGDPANITVGGYSAGAHSAFHQLAHELYFVPDDQAVIKRTICWSNSPGVQPRTAQQHQKQFDELLDGLNICRTLSSEAKLEKLRSVSIEALVEVQSKLNICEFRATSDNAFVSKHLIANINNGDFAKRMKMRKIKFMNGECRDEHNLYRAWRTPANTYDAAYTRLTGDYPEDVVDKLMRHYCAGTQSLPAKYKDWQDLFGHIYADMQVHHLERGLHRALEKGGLVYGKDVLRYRFDWRAKCVDIFFPPEWEVTHATDMAIWFWGLDYGNGLTDQEKQLLKSWNAGFSAFVQGEETGWGTMNVGDMKRLRSDGATDVWQDDRWDAGLEVWDLVNGSSPAGLVGWLRSRM